MYEGQEDGARCIAFRRAFFGPEGCEIRPRHARTQEGEIRIQAVDARAARYARELIANIQLALLLSIGVRETL